MISRKHLISLALATPCFQAAWSPMAWAAQAFTGITQQAKCTANILICTTQATTVCKSIISAWNTGKPWNSACSATANKWRNARANSSATTAPSNASTTKSARPDTAATPASACPALGAINPQIKGSLKRTFSRFRLPFAAPAQILPTISVYHACQPCCDNQTSGSLKPLKKRFRLPFLLKSVYVQSSSQPTHRAAMPEFSCAGFPFSDCLKRKSLFASRKIT